MYNGELRDVPLCLANILTMLQPPLWSPGQKTSNHCNRFLNEEDEGGEKGGEEDGRDGLGRGHNVANES